MNLVRSLILGGCLLGLAACTNANSFSEVKALNEAKAVGSPFTQDLAAGYRTFANDELMKEYDYPDALHFARKGLAAANGDTVLPEPISDWNLLPEDINELATARGRLLVVFDAGAREVSPQPAATAQVKFDCWIEQQEEGWQTKDIHNCKSEFEAAMSQLESQTKKPVAADFPPPVEATAANSATPMKTEDAMYLVFFDFKKSDITTSAQSVLDTIVTEAKGRTLKAVHVVGHTDTSGPKSVNNRLSMERANAVRDYLTGHGVDGSIIDVQGRGEDELLVKTPDGVREPANRRAQISFE